MEEFIRKINSIVDIHRLNAIKENLKDRVIDSSLHWKERMKLYSKVQLINERIHTLTENTKKRGE